MVYKHTYIHTYMFVRLYVWLHAQVDALVYVVTAISKNKLKKCAFVLGQKCMLESAIHPAALQWNPGNKLCQWQIPPPPTTTVSNTCLLMCIVITKWKNTFWVNKTCKRHTFIYNYFTLEYNSKKPPGIGVRNFQKQMQFNLTGFT